MRLPCRVMPIRILRLTVVALLLFAVGACSLVPRLPGTRPSPTSSPSTAPMPTNGTPSPSPASTTYTIGFKITGQGQFSMVYTVNGKTTTVTDAELPWTASVQVHDTFEVSHRVTARTGQIHVEDSINGELACYSDASGGAGSVTCHFSGP